MHPHVTVIASDSMGIGSGSGNLRLITYIDELIRTRGGDVPKEGIRLSLGRSLALALEFQLGADILATALNPSQKDVTILAAIVVLRTALNYFLQQEIDRAAQRQGNADLPPSPNLPVKRQDNASVVR